MNIRLNVMHISIVTPWQNHPELIPEYERAVRAADQVVIYDNASELETALQLQDMCERLGGEYVRSETNRMFAPANNEAYGYTTGDIVLFLNNDIRATGDWLHCVRYEVTDRVLIGANLTQTRFTNGRDVSYIEGWCIAATRATWDLLGCWDADSFVYPYWEDVDLSQRAIRFGIGLVQGLWPIEHMGNVTLRGNPSAGDYMEHNRKIVEDRFVDRERRFLINA